MPCRMHTVHGARSRLARWRCYLNYTDLTSLSGRRTAGLPVWPSLRVEDFGPFDRLLPVGHVLGKDVTGWFGNISWLEET